LRVEDDRWRTTDDGGRRTGENVEYRMMNNEGKREKAQICLATENTEGAEKCNHELTRIGTNLVW